MKSFKMKLAGACAAAGTAGLVLAGGPALASSAPAHHGGGRFGQENITGFLSGPRAVSSNPVVPLRLTGVVNTFGTINLGGNASVTGIATFAGTLTVAHGNPSPPPQVNFRTCRVTEIIHTWTRVLGSQSTGVFRGARGSGQATVVFSALAPRLRNGRCNLKAPPLPFGASIAFNASTSLQLQHHHGR
jgi:hypothetical protein